MIESIEKGLLAKVHITVQQKTAFASSMIMGLIAHLYILTNMLLNCDTVMSYYKASDPYSFEALLGNFGGIRWLLPLSEMISFWYRTPMITGILILLLCGAFAVIYVSLYDIRTKSGAIICGALSAVFPTIASYMSLGSVGYMTSALFILLGLYLLEKKDNMPAAVIVVALSLAVMPLNIISLIVGYIYLIFLKILRADHDKDEIIPGIIRFAILAIIEGAILFGGAKLRIAVTGEETAAYQGQDVVLSGSFITSLWANLMAAFSKTRIMRISNMQQLPTLKFTLRICYFVQLISIIFCFIRNRVYKKPLNAVILGLCVVVMPFALSAFTVISPDFVYNGQHRMQWVLVLSGTWMLLECADSVLPKIQKESVLRLTKSLFAVVLVNMIIMIYGFTIYDNVMYYSAQHVADKDESLMIRILAELDSTEDFDYDNSGVYFLVLQEVATSDTTLSPLALEPELYNTMVWDNDTNLWCFGDRELKAHMYKYEGVALKNPSWDVIEKIENDYGKYKEEYMELKQGDFEVIEYPTNTDESAYVVVVKTYVSYGLNAR